MGKDFMRAYILACSFLRFDEKSVIFFNAHAFLIPTRKRPINDTQGCVHIFEDVIELTVNVNGKNFNHAKKENDILHEKFCKIFRMCFRSTSRDYKPC